MTSDELVVLLEIGKKRRVVAAATAWPGLDRWGTSEDDAIERLLAYVPRYRRVAERAGLADELDAQGTPHVAERTPGSSSTDFWGIAHVPSELERAPLTPAELERRLTLLQAVWATFDAIAADAPADLLPGPRSAGRTRDQIVRHVLINEPEQMTRKVEVRTPPEAILTPAGLAAHRAATLEAIRAYVAEGRPARTWPVPFLIRRIAHHLLDHAWELEDRDPRRAPAPAGDSDSGR